MANLTKKQVQSLESILFDLERVQKFLLKDSTIVATETKLTSDQENTWKCGNRVATTFNKNIGNDLCYLYNAKDRLNSFLNSNK